MLIYLSFIWAELFLEQGPSNGGLDHGSIHIFQPFSVNNREPSFKASKGESVFVSVNDIILESWHKRLNKSNADEVIRITGLT